MNGWVGDDPNPEYSRLDRADGLPRMNQSDANRILDAARGTKSVPVSGKPAPFPPVSAFVAAAQKPEINLRPRRRVGGVVGTAFLFIGVAVVASVMLGVARMVGVL